MKAPYFLLPLLFLAACATPRESLSPPAISTPTDIAAADAPEVRLPAPGPGERPADVFTRPPAPEIPAPLPLDVARWTSAPDATVSSTTVEPALIPKLGQPPPMLSQTGVLEVFGRLSIEQKVGQRFISWVPGNEMSATIEEIVRERYLGGIIFSDTNIVDTPQIQGLIGEIQDLAGRNEPALGLFMAVDQEGGRVARLRMPHMTRFASPFHWGEHDDPAYVRSAAYLIGAEIRDLGFNVNFAPVLDLYPRPDHSIIGDRSMGDDPEQIAVFARYYIEGAKSAGIIPVAKHYPGHGVTTIDSHVRLPTVNLSREELLATSFAPFRSAVESGVDAIMTSHVVFSSFDPDYPATLSEILVSEVLRSQFGFDGVVVSDAIEMGALRAYFDIDEVLTRAFRAGVDIILVSGYYRIGDLMDRVLALIDQGSITMRDLDRGVLRVLELKHKTGLLR